MMVKSRIIQFILLRKKNSARGGINEVLRLYLKHDKKRNTSPMNELNEIS